MATEWRFAKKAKGAINKDPVEAEFFQPEEGFAAALVREALQNSLDAASGPSGVLVRFTFGRAEGQDATFGNCPFFVALDEHLSAAEHEKLIAPPDSALIPYLAVEDFGTTGLRGDVLADDEDELGRNDFFYFWRNVGRSGKGENDRGRWGLGKTVFPASSRMSAFFGLTVRAGDTYPKLMGQFVGKVHRVDEQKYDPYGFFGYYESEDAFALPVRDHAALSRFKDAFNLSRNIEEPGLSVVIVFPHKELQPEGVLQESIFGYYIPIVQKQLVVSVVTEDGEQRVTDETIEDVARQLNWSGHERSLDEMLSQIAFARRCLGVVSTDFVVTATVGSSGPPVFNEAIVPSETLQTLRDRFETEEIIALKVPIQIVQEQKKSIAEFRAFLVKDPSLAAGKGEFVRQGLTISRVDRPPRAGQRGMVLVENDALARLLGDSENPSHTKWQERRLKDRGYEYGPGIVRCLSRSLTSVSEILSRPPTGRDKHVLEDVFYIDQSSEADESQGVGPGQRGTARPVPPIVTNGTKSPVSIQPTKGGFRLTGKTNDGNPIRVVVDCAYAVRRGDPFRRYEPFDFTVDKKPISYQATGAEVVEAGMNRIVLAPTDATFEIEVGGFDTRRDLAVRASVRNGSAE